jgi:hypothetical protein
METDDVAIIVAGTVLWLVALAVLVAVDEDDWAQVSAAGAFLGLIGIRYVVRRRARLRAAPATDQVTPEPRPGIGPEA